MSIILIGWGRFFDAQGNRITVPAPPTDPGSEWLWQSLADMSAELGTHFDGIQIPPCSMTQSGTAPTGDGYGVKLWRDLGQWSPTRYGTLEDLLRLVAKNNANGMVTLGDAVLHQLDPEENQGVPGTSLPLGADRKTRNGLDATTAGWFRGQTSWNATTLTWNDPIPPFRPQDAVPSPSDDFAFGREICYQNCLPSGVTLNAAKAYLLWLSKRLGISQFRIDDTKGTYAPAIREILNAIPNGSFYSEYFDGNPANLDAWARGPVMQSRSAVEDFTLHWRLQAACNNYDARQFIQGGNMGYWNLWSGGAVGFVDNPDTDTSRGVGNTISQQVVFNKRIAYAILLNLPLKQALVYGKDYFPSSLWPGAYGLKPSIDNLCWISDTFAYGNFQERWTDKDVFCFTRDGNGGNVGWSGGLLVATNFNTLSSRTITVGTTFGPNVHLHDYTGHAPDVWTHNDGSVTITIPSNNNSSGQSYVAYAVAGVTYVAPTVQNATTQVFAGDQVLDILPAFNGNQTLPQRVYAMKGTAIKVAVTSPKLGWTGASQIFTSISGPDGVDVCTHQLLNIASSHVDGVVKTEGWHTISMVGYNLPVTGSTFEVSVTYTGA